MNLKRKLAHEEILSEPYWKHICFSEQDDEVTGTEKGGSGGAGTAGAESEGEPAAEPDGDVDEAASDAETVADDEDDLEIGAEKYRVKKPIKEAWNGLQKTVQTSKEEHKAKLAEVEAQRKSNDETIRIAASYMKQIGKIQAINDQLEPYEKLTTAEWIAWSEQDADAAKKAQTAIFAMRMEKDKLAKEINDTENTIRSKAATDTATRKAQAERDLAAQIKDWSPAKKETLTKVAKEYDFSDAELEPFSYDPRVMRLLDDAKFGREAKARAESTSGVHWVGSWITAGKPEINLVNASWP